MGSRPISKTSRDVLREAVEFAYRDHGLEPSVAPKNVSAYPPPTMKGLGSPPAVKYDLDGTSKRFTSVWAILLIIVAVFGAGWGASSTFGQYLKLEQLVPLTNSVEAVRLDVAAMRTTQMGLQKDVEWIKQAMRVVNTEQQPLGGKVTPQTLVPLKNIP